MKLNFYVKIKSKRIKFCNLEIPSPNFAAPNSLIPFDLNYI